MKTVIQLEFSIIGQNGQIVARGTGGATGDTVDGALADFHREITDNIGPQLPPGVDPMAMQYECVILRVILVSDDSPLLLPKGRILTS